MVSAFHSRLLGSALALVAVLTACGQSPAVPDTAGSLTALAVNDGTYEIVNVNSGKLLEVTGSSQDDGAPMQQWTRTGAANQKWKLVDQGDGSYKIESVNSGKALDVAAASLDDGATVHQWTYFGAANQKWKLVDQGDGSYKIESVSSGKALDVSGVSQDNGAKVHQWTYFGAANQKWKLVNLSAPPTPTVAPTTGSTTYEIVNVNSGKLLEVTGSSQDDGAPMQQWTRTGAANQKWKLVDQGNGSYKIENLNSGKVLDVAAASLDDGATVHQWTDFGAANQRWKLVDQGDGSYKIESVNSGKALDVSGVSQDNGARVHQWTYFGAANQKWKLVALNSAPTGTSGNITQNPVSVQNAVPKIIANPSSALVDVNQELVIDAKVTDLNGKTYPASSLEWKSLNPDVLQIIALTNNGYSARVRVMQAQRGGQLLVRSKDDSSVVSETILVANASLQPGVRRLNDTDVLFPAKRWALYSPTLPDGYNNASVGSFTPSELAANTSVDQAGTAPMVVRGTDYAVGDLVIAGGDAALNGRVQSVTKRDGNSLLVIRPVTPGVLIQNVVVNPPSQDDLNAWASGGNDVLTNGLNSQSLRAQDTKSAGGWTCESAAGLTGVEFSLKSSASIQPIVSAAPSVVNGQANTLITLGVRVPLALTASVSLPLGFVSEFKCTDKNNQMAVDVPIGGPFSAFAISGELKVAPVVKISVAAKDTAIVSGYTVKITPMTSASFSVGDDGFVGGEFKFALDKPEMKPTGYQLSPNALSAEVKALVGIEGKGGLSLGGALGSKVRGVLEKLPSNPLTDVTRTIANGATYFNVFKVTSGVEGKIVWASEGLLKLEKRNVSTAGLSLVYESAFENDQASALLSGLKKLGFNANKFIAMKAESKSVEVDKWYSGLKSSDVKFDGVAAGSTVQLRASGATASLSTNFEFPSVIGAAPAKYGVVDIVGVGRYDLGLSGATLSGIIPELACDKLQSPKTGHVFAYNMLAGLLDTASYIGEYQFTCSGTLPRRLPPIGVADFDGLPSSCAGTSSIDAGATNPDNAIVRNTLFNENCSSSSEDMYLISYYKSTCEGYPTRQNETWAYIYNPSSIRLNIVVFKQPYVYHSASPDTQPYITVSADLGGTRTYPGAYGAGLSFESFGDQTKCRGYGSFKIVPYSSLPAAYQRGGSRWIAQGSWERNF